VYLVLTISLPRKIWQSLVFLQEANRWKPRFPCQITMIPRPSHAIKSYVLVCAKVVHRLARIAHNGKKVSMSSDVSLQLILTF